MKKLAVVSRSFAPLVIGSPVLLDNLFSSYPGDYEVVAGWQYDAKTDDKFVPNCKISYLKFPNSYIQRIFDKFIFQLRFLVKLFIDIKIKSIKPDAVFGVFPSPEFFVSAFQISKKYNIPFIVHMHDLWEENIDKNQKLKKSFAIKWEKIIFNEAHTIFCMNNVQADHYEEKYGIKTKILPHTIRSEFLKKNISFNIKKHKNKIKKILYTGNISHLMNLDAMQQFIKSVNYLPDYYEIKIFCSFDVDTCKKLSLYNDRIKYDWLPIKEVKVEMADADLLFLPLSHKNGAMDEVRTVFATKTLEYLISGTPILVFSPKNSFHSISAKSGNWGHVIDIDEPKEIANGIKKVINNKNLSKNLVENAFNEALSRDSRIFSEKLFKSLP